MKDGDNAEKISLAHISRNLPEHPLQKANDYLRNSFYELRDKLVISGFPVERTPNISETIYRFYEQKVSEKFHKLYSTNSDLKKLTHYVAKFAEQMICNPDTDYANVVEESTKIATYILLNSTYLLEKHQSYSKIKQYLQTCNTSTMRSVGNSDVFSTNPAHIEIKILYREIQNLLGDELFPDCINSPSVQLMHLKNLSNVLQGLYPGSNVHSYNIATAITYCANSIIAQILLDDTFNILKSSGFDFKMLDLKYLETKDFWMTEICEDGLNQMKKYLKKFCDKFYTEIKNSANNIINTQNDYLIWSTPSNSKKSVDKSSKKSKSTMAPTNLPKCNIVSNDIALQNSITAYVTQQEKIFSTEKKPTKSFVKNKKIEKFKQITKDILRSKTFQVIIISALIISIVLLSVTQCNSNNTTDAQTATSTKSSGGSHDSIFVTPEKYPERIVYVSKYKLIHSNTSCSGLQYYTTMKLEQAEREHYKYCSKCW